MRKDNQMNLLLFICDSSLATWTTYRNYREQRAEGDSVQLDKKNVRHLLLMIRWKNLIVRPYLE